MNNQLLIKLFACLPVGMAFIVSAMLFSGSAHAQIVYTDVSPDYVSSCIYPTACGAAYSLDLNNDGINDFTLSSRALRFGCGSNCSPGGPAALGQQDSAVVISTAQSWFADTVGGFNLNTLIDSTLDWKNTVYSLVKQRQVCQQCTSSTGQPIPRASRKSTLPTIGSWQNVSGKYLALKIQVGTLFYYGWVKLAVSNASYSVSIRIMEYAFNSTPNQPIKAGEYLVTSISDNISSSSIALYPNPASNQFTVDLGGNNQKVKVIVSDLSGKKVLETVSSGAQKFEVNTNDLQEGTYVVQIQAEHFIGTKRLIVSK